MRHLKEMINQSPEVKTRWIKIAEALESGQYIQENPQLSSKPQCFCIEGLMRELSGMDSGVLDSVRRIRAYLVVDKNGNVPLMGFGMPNNIREYSDMNTEFFLLGDERMTLIFLNDRGNSPFESFAAIIRESLEQGK